MDRRIVNRFIHAGEGSRDEFRSKWAEVIVEMVRFSPRLVLISAGFDAHADDPLANCTLRDADYAWATAAVMEACRSIDAADPPPVISVLEGGYDLVATAASAAAHVQALVAGW